MVFSSLTFLFFFLPFAVLGHLLMPDRLKNPFLILCSILFYAWGDLRYLPLMLILTVFGWGCGRAEGKWTLFGAAAFVLVLIVYKYSGMFPFVKNPPALPLGISFYTFQSVSYLLDVRAGRMNPERSLERYAAYILLFPQLIAGPIVRYSDVAGALGSRKISAERLEKGMRLFLAGLASKVLLANRIGKTFDALVSVQGRGAAATAAALICCGFQYYYDFCGYSLMAVGMGHMLGFRFPENFRHPFACVSVREFWRRWHITLGSWLKTYVYIPLGGSRRGKARMVLNLLITWGISGIWHGAGFNFLAWGLYYGVLIALEDLLFGKYVEEHRLIGHIYAFSAVTLGWVLFSCGSAPEIAAMLLELIHPAIGKGVPLILAGSALPAAVCAAFAVPEVCAGAKRITDKCPVLLILLLVLCIAELLRSSYNPFLYFRF